MFSRTAAVIALAGLRDRSASATAGDDDVSDGMARRFLAACPTPWPWLSRHATARWFRWLSSAVETWRMPGIAAHYRARKAVIRGWVEEEIGSGLEQVLILGAGADPLGHVLARRGLVVHEIDHPETSARKRIALGEGANRRLSLLAADLSSVRLADLLNDARIDRRRWTLVIAEGLAMYLEPDILRRHLADLEKHFTARHVLVATVLAQGDDGRVLPRWRSRWLSRWLRHGGEPFRWSIRADTLRAEVSARGWQVSRIGDVDELGAAERPCPGELILRASRM